MSCKACEERQDSPVSAYFRWKNANIEMRGCDEHLREVFEVLRREQSTAVTPPERPVVRVPRG